MLFCVLQGRLFSPELEGKQRHDLAKNTSQFEIGPLALEFDLVVHLGRFISGG